MNGPLFFPPCQESLASSSISSSTEAIHSTTHSPTFEQVCQQAIESQVPVILTQDVVLSTTICLRNEQTLTLEGQCSPTISGDLHSLFLLNNKSRLVLQNVNLHHTLETDNHKQVGAAVNLRYKASAQIQSSKIESASGFAVWAVQKSTVKLQECQLVAKSRSAMVCFGQATCQLVQCHIDQAGVHGLCARGACRLELWDSRITASAGRAIYAYANASVELHNCHVSGTLHPDKAAIEVSSMGCNSETSSALTIWDCQIVDNHGVGIRIRGPVSYQEQGNNNVLERNAKGNWDIQETLLEGDDDGQDLLGKQHDGDQGTLMPPMKRDAAGSSFRRGDWWCTNCHQINAASTSSAAVDGDVSCRRCTNRMSTSGRLLTMDEIRQCNQGIDIRVAAAATTLPNSSTSPSEDLSSTTKFAQDQGGATSEELVEWQFDGDDKGWLAYDHTSARLLEDAFQQQQQRKMRIHLGGSSTTFDGASPPELGGVYLSGGNYHVNVKTMEQINTETQCLRIVRRRIIGTGKKVTAKQKVPPSL